MTARISVIIPTLNEAVAIGRTLESLARGPDIELIVTDGGSTDETVSTAESFAVKIVRSPQGKAVQMNCGSRRATGSILLFLHADTILPAGWTQQVQEILDRPGVAAGAFRLAIDAPEWGFRVIESVTNFRSRYLRTPYGDQAIFLKAELFQQLGGYLEIPILEDFDLVRRLRNRGRIEISSLPVTTSARRWRKLGLVRTTLTNWAIIAAHSLGVSPVRLAKWYRPDSIAPGDSSADSRPTVAGP